MNIKIINDDLTFTDVDISDYKKPEYSKKQVTQAGATFIDDASSVEEKARALQIIHNYHSAHAYPMQIVYPFLRRMCRYIHSAIVPNT